MFKTIRIVILLFILAAVALATWRAKSDAVAWKYTLTVHVFPVNGDGSATAERYIRALTVDEFTPLERFMRDESRRYGRASEASIEMRLGPVLATPPPPPPSVSAASTRGAHALAVMWWSLRLRWWAYQNTQVAGPGPQVKLFVLYFDPARHSQLDHSTALQKGLIGRVNVFADRAMSRQNNVIIAHEFLHTLGASDKYDLATTLPIFPDGYAEPERVPALPQTLAEIMGGRVPLSASEAAIPHSLQEVVIGTKTAQEINWLH